MIELTQEWRSTHPGAAMGILIINDINFSDRPPQLEQKKMALETQLRDRYQGQDRSAILQLPVMQAYSTYYKRFRKTYHLLLQLESIIIKGKPIPKAPALVEAMFMAELESLLLTAGHDLDQINDPIIVDASSGDEVYTLLRGETVSCKTGDMVMVDPQGVFCSIIYGQDQRTRITNKTQNVLYAVYVPPGIDSDLIEGHLGDLEQNVGLISSEAKIISHQIYMAE
jgi:DNA/RNA-binding domain of Phe-tRNA-synthetase-like protein